MSEQTRKIVLPAYLAKRLDAFRIVKDGAVSHLLRDKLHNRTFDYEVWQWFVLEVLPGCETHEKLQSVFKDRFDRALSPAELDELFDSLVERKLLDVSALQHPLLEPYARLHFESDAQAPAGGLPAAPAPVAGEPPAPVKTVQVVLPGHVVKRVKAERVDGPDGPLYYLNDEMHDKAVELQPWQFFVLESLPTCDTRDRLVEAVRGRFNVEPTQAELDNLFASLADRKLFDANALKHPLLRPFAERTFEVVDGKAVVKKQVEKVAAGTRPSSTTAPAAERKPLPAGVQDVAGLDPAATSRMWPLFDPRPILRWLVPVLRPLRFLIYLLPLLLVAALMLVFKHGSVLLQDLHRQHGYISLFEHLLFALLTLNLLGTILMASVAHWYKAAVERICITLYVGFIPRFVNRIDGVERLSRRQVFAIHGGNLAFRAFMFCLAVLVWYNTRDLKGTLHEAALAMVLTAGASLLLETGNPLMKGSSYFLLSAYLDEPHLRGKAFKALMNKLRGGVYQQADGNVMAIYAIAFISYAFFLVTFLTIGLGQWLLGHLDIGGSAILIVLGLMAFLYWRNYKSLKKFGEAYERNVQYEKWRKRTLIEKGAEEGEVKEERSSYWGRATIACLVVLLFVPYPYELAGTFQMYPSRRQVLSTDTPGLIQEVFFDGGEAVKAGTVLARLAGHDFEVQVSVLDARIVEQKAVVAELKSRPRKEAVHAAAQAVEIARTREAFSRDKVPRLEKLYQSRVLTFEELDAARKDHLTDVSQLAEKQAALDLVKVGAPPDEIAAAEARVLSLQEERAGFVSKLERTHLRMPFDGNILTLHLKDRTNSYLDRGQPFATVESTGTITAEVELPESDVQYVAQGASVRVRPSAYFSREFVGTVATIDRNVTPKSFGNVVKVLVSLENADGLLKTGMTGEAKVAGPTMPVWQAFSQAMVRFVRVQAWAWLP
jgi:putative peptide zinc metalloprotease protein